MIHLPNLITDLGLILGAAAIITLIFKYLKQPLVLGYLIAGFLVGPHFTLFPTIVETENVTVWAEIGVIILLFSLGLEFSFKKLMKVGGSASITAVTEVVVMLLLGYFTGKAFGWSTMDSIFLGGILSISSTTIIIRAFEELGVKGQKFAGLVFGVLVVEDLVAVVLLVLLSTLAVSQQFAGSEMLFSILKLIFFLVIWFVLGIFFLPSFLKKIKPLISEEMLLIISLALCFLMVIAATKVGFSPALGAFIMGSILAETSQGKKIEHLVMPIKDLFGAVFFVSVGMLIDPAMLVEHALPVVIIVLVTIVGKIFSSSIGALASGQPLKTSVQTGFSLAQIGEFSFIIATLGVTLNVTSSFLYPIAVAVSAISTFTTPYLIKLSFPFYNWLNKVLPSKWIENLNRYSSATQSVTTVSNWQLFVKSYTANTLIHFSISLAIILISSNYLSPFIQNKTENAVWSNIISLVITMLILSPFLYALTFRNLYSGVVVELKNERLYRNLVVVMRLFRLLLSAALIITLLNNLLSVEVALYAALIIIVVLLIFWKQVQKVYLKLEMLFLKNYNDEEYHPKKEQEILAPWDAHFTEIEVKPESPAVGKTLMELKWRERAGINVAMINRGSLTIHSPESNTIIYPGDILNIIGTDAQIRKLNSIIRPDKKVLEQQDHYQPKLHKLLVRKNSFLEGKSLKESKIKDLTDGIVVGIERNAERIVNPESNWVFQENDMVWIVGDSSKIQSTL
ncbi:cation:proton antiporter [Pedobacter glucosidilyticus]|uniref:cation:proton antiporter domain-containing protein n=1 Tax=Pedobacter glucosidilyticus TaxID=1122941 RepID=UPI0026EBFD59|nr:cation:proton antiporter [Pedobacter glucosidilyticus]